jgi:hypothetical protein
MPRGTPSLADENLIAALAAEDTYVSPFQLERWRRQRQLPRPVRRGRGRGKGSESAYPKVALDTARVLAEEAWQGRSRHYGTFATFTAGALGRSVYYEEAAVREAFVWALERMRRFLEKKRARDPEAVDKLAEQIRSRVKIYDPVLWHIAPPEHPTRGEAKARAEARRELSEVRAMRAMLFFDDPSQFGSDFMADAMGFSGWSVEELRKGFIEFERANEGVLFEEGTPSMLESMIEWAQVVDFDLLCRARDAFLGVGSAHMILVICSGITESARRFLIELRQSDAGRFFAEVIYAGNRPEQMVSGSLQTSMDEDYLEAMTRYGQELSSRVLPFMVETHARAVLTVGGDAIANVGTGLFEMAVHAVIDHDDENWHTPEFRGTMLELLAAMKGCGMEHADPYNVIAKLFADLDE